MKTKLFVFGLLMVLFCVAEAQETTVVTKDVTSAFGDGRHNTLVRNWPGTKFSITCCMDDAGQKCIFRMLDAGSYLGGATVSPLPIREVELPLPLVHVSEFRVVGDCLFFGATDAASSVYFGYFDLNQFLSGTSVTFGYTTVSSDYPLYKIEGFKDSYGFKVFALGSWVAGSVFNYRIFEFDPPIGSISYKYVDLPDTLPIPRGLVDDVVVLKNEVLFVGRDNHFSSTCCICIRKVSKAQGLDDPSIGNHYHFLNPDPAICEYNSVIQAKPLSETTFAIAYTHSHSNASSRRIRVFDNQPAELNAQEYPLDDKAPMYEMAYTKKNKTVTIVEPFAGTSRFVFIHPDYLSSYNALAMYGDAEDYKSLDTISGLHYLSASPRRWVLQYADQISYLPDVYTNSCLDDQTIKVGIPAKLDFIMDNFPIPPDVDPASFNSPVSPVDPNKINVDCMSN